jgi:maleylacetate reductase
MLKTYLPPGMIACHLDVPFLPTVLTELQRLGRTRVFVMANRSSSKDAQRLADSLGQRLAAPPSLHIGMGGGEAGLLKTCDDAASVGADCLVTIGGGAIQDAGKLVRMWLSASDGCASVAKILAAAKRTGLPTLQPQIACPNSFAMAEMTPVAGITTSENVKTGIAHPAIVPTIVVFDPALCQGLPHWVRYGTALRGIEHGVGAICSPAATDESRELALEGLRTLRHGLTVMLRDPDSRQGQSDVYRGGWYAMKALSAPGCYPALGHFVQNHYSARFNIHQGSCSGILSARLLAHHASVTGVAICLGSVSNCSDSQFVDHGLL